MKKVTLLLSIAFVNAVLFNTKGLAQDESAFDKGTVVVTAGLGFPDFYRIDQRASYKGYNSSSVKGFGPLIFKGDYGIIKFNWGHTLGAGIVLGYNSTTIDFAYTDYRWNNGNNGYNYYAYSYNQTDKFKTITVGARASYHFFTKEKVDCYANVGLGYNIRTYSRTTNDPNGGYSYATGNSTVYTAFTAGIRYYFTKNFGVYAELGWDMSAPMQGGIALKF